MKVRLTGLAQKGYCASLKRWFYGVKEHIIWTPQGRIAFIIQTQGNRHDIQGLYAMLKTSFEGHLLGDNGYWPKADMRRRLEEKGIFITAEVRSNWRYQYSEEQRRFLRKNRARVERLIALFDAQFAAYRTLCRSLKHYITRRWMKAVSYNCSRRLNTKLDKRLESVIHYRLAA